MDYLKRANLFFKNVVLFGDKYIVQYGLTFIFTKYIKDKWWITRCHFLYDNFIVLSLFLSLFHEKKGGKKKKKGIQKVSLFDSWDNYSYVQICDPVLCAEDVYVDQRELWSSDCVLAARPDRPPSLSGHLLHAPWNQEQDIYRAKQYL